MSVALLESENPYVALLQKELERNAGGLPVLPAIAKRALELARTTEMDFAEVASVAELDPPLAARLLAMANSALYFRGTRVSSLHAALIRLGTEGVRDILYMAVYSGAAFNVPEFRTHVEEVFRHSVVVARGARMVAPYLDQDPELAFVAGLLHDMGEARCLKIASKRLKRAQFNDPALFRAIEILHPSAGAELAAAWRLPKEVVEACAFHHAPGERLMACIVAAANASAKYLTGKLAEDEAQTLFEDVGLRNEQFCEIVERMREDLGKLHSFGPLSS